MSEQNGKVCCNCRHRILTKDKRVKDTCDIDGSYIGYVKCMTGWCRHWAKERGDTDGKDADNG